MCEADSVANLKVSAKMAGISWGFGMEVLASAMFALSLYLAIGGQALTQPQ